MTIAQPVAYLKFSDNPALAITSLMKNRHLHLKEQSEKLNQKLRGYCAYYGIKGNSQSLDNFFYRVRLEWKKWLGRRCQRRDLNWEKFRKILKREQLVKPRIVHWEI